MRVRSTGASQNNMSFKFHSLKVDGYIHAGGTLSGLSNGPRVSLLTSDIGAGSIGHLLRDTIYPMKGDAFS